MSHRDLLGGLYERVDSWEEINRILYFMLVLYFAFEYSCMKVWCLELQQPPCDRWKENGYPDRLNHLNQHWRSTTSIYFLCEIERSIFKSLSDFLLETSKFRADKIFPSRKHSQISSLPRRQNVFFCYLSVFPLFLCLYLWILLIIFYHLYSKFLTF